MITPSRRSLPRFILPLLFLLPFVVEAQAPGTAPEVFRIDSVLVRGNVRSSARYVQANSGFSAGGTILATQVKSAVQRAIRNIYALGMFSDVTILHEVLSPGHEKIIIQVREYDVLNKLTITGADKLKKDDLLKKIRIGGGQIVNPNSLSRAVEDILKEYRSEGYYLAKVDPVLSELGRGLVDVDLKISEGKKVQVKRVSFVGTKVLPERKLREQMDTKEDRWWRSADFDEDKFKEDKTKIIAYYRKHGYREAAIVSDSIYLDKDQEDLFIDIRIEEGRQYRYGKIAWSGNVLISDPQVHRLLALREGDLYNRDEFDAAVMRVHSAYQEEGYWAATVVPTESPRSDTIDVRFEVAEGAPSRVNFIHIEGNDKTKDKVIRRELTLVPGDIFRRSDLERSHRNVFYLNYFELVEPDIKPMPSGDVDVILKIKEKPTGTVNMSVGYGEVDKWVGAVGLSIPNLMGNGQRMDFQWEFGQTKTSFYLSFTEPWMFDTPTSGTITLFNTRQELDVTEESRGFTLRLGRKLRWPDDYSSIYSSYSFRTESYTFPSSFTRTDRQAYVSDPDDPTLISSAFGVGYVRDSRNLPMFPTEGTYFSYDFKVAGGPFGGDVTYRRHMADARYYLPLFDILGWVPALAVKTTFGQINTRDPLSVPLSERFRPGGVSYDGQIRGYYDYGIGPKNSYGGSTGGFTMLINSAEISFPIVKDQIYVLTFADAGNAWASLDQMNPYELRRSIGFGVRFILPLAGVIGLDFAYGYDRPAREGGPRWETHFQFGPTILR
jgi:outer membrane protein insertion porin family